jgi:NAD(P)-dependent dehydrogenase (short-subunit alcohol dehydrogenase family)
MEKNILITGCSSGIGLDAATTLHASGKWRVFAACRQQKDCDRMRKEHGLETCLIDYSKPETIASGLEHVLGQTGWGLYSC